jgi:putative transposase
VVSMPRKGRIDAPGALHHIIIRGIERRKIFRDDKDRDEFVRRIGLIFGESCTACYAWALIPNHAHLLLRTGTVAISTVMRRLLTGYAVYFNRRHRRHGQLFQNRYKSILCQEDAYLLELVRYIHLNPLRAGLVKGIEELSFYPYSGHGALMGRRNVPWQDVDYVLGCFGQKVGAGRRRYGQYVEKGIGLGSRPELVGGGLVRSLGGWNAAKRARREQGRIKGDERVLGDSAFVAEVLKAADEALEGTYHLRAQGYDVDRVANRVAELLGLEPKDVLAPGKYPRIVLARSVFCYWAVRALGMTATEVAKRLGITQPGVSVSVQRGEKIVAEKKLKLFDE